MAQLVAKLAIVALPALLSSVGPAGAQYPERPISLIVSFAAGGPADVIARLVGKHMTTSLRQPIIMENITGAGGTIGAAHGAHAKPDGYTITMGHFGTHGAAPAQYPNIRYHPVRDFTPRGLVAGTPILLVAKSSLPASNMKEFVSLLKTRQASLTEAHAGVGSVSDFWIA